jgi:hypothetical protein
MSTQPKALFFADVLDSDPRSPVLHVEAAEELRRLHALNGELLEALESLLWYVGQLEALVYSDDDAVEHEEVIKARAAIAKAEGA